MALWSLPFGLVLGPMSAGAWDLGGETPTRPGPAWFGVWLAEHALDRMGNMAPPSMFWGAAHAVSVLPVALTMIAVRQRLFATWGRTGAQVALVAFLAGSVAMLSAYTMGFGFPIDLFAFLVAAVATIILGVRILVKRKAPASLGWTSSVGLVVALGASLWWCGPYVPAFIALGLTAVWGAIGVLTARLVDAAPLVANVSSDGTRSGIA